MTARPPDASTAPAYLALWFPCLATDRLARAGMGAPDAPGLATVREAGNGQFLAAVDPRAARAGLKPGMTLASARALMPDLATRPADPRADAVLIARLAGWCERYTPLGAVAGPDRLILDATGCAHLLGGPAGLLEDARRRLEAAGLTVRAALAPSPAAASALAVHGPPDSLVARRGDLERALADLPVAALRLADAGVDADTLDGLRRVGLRRLGDLAGLARAALAARFGPGVPGALDRLAGREDTPLAFRRRPARYRLRLGFPDPIGLRDDIEAGLRRLLTRLRDRMEADGRGCRRLALTACRADGDSRTVEIGTARPVRAPDALLRLFREKLEAIDPGFGIDCLILSVPLSEPLTAEQIGTRTRRDERDLAGLCDRLANRLGAGAVFRLAARDSRLPDRAQETAPPLPGNGPPRPWPETPARPPLLFARPRPLNPLRDAHRDAPPLAFRLDGRRHAIRAAAGPERIAPDWWRADPDWAGGTRDYWWVEDMQGRRFWIYRDETGRDETGRDETGGAAPRWYLHGTWQAP